MARFSTVQLLGNAGSTLRTQRPGADLIAALTKEMAGRGFALVDRGETPGGVEVYVFRGTRSSATVVSATRSSVGSKTFDFGSVFYAIVRPIPLGVNPSGAELFLFGKPTVNGADLCSDTDAALAEFSYRCKNIHVQEDSTLRANITGREETDVVRGVLLTLAMEFPPPGGVPPR